MTNVQHRDSLLCVVNLVDDSVVAYSNPPAIAPAQLSTATWSGILRQLAYGVLRSLIRRVGKLSQFLLRTTQDEDAVTY